MCIWNKTPNQKTVKLHSSPASPDLSCPDVSLFDYVAVLTTYNSFAKLGLSNGRKGSLSLPQSGKEIS